MSEYDPDDLDPEDLDAEDLDAEDLEHSIAILSMACRFPGADDPEAFWRNLAEGVESITFFSDQELIAAGADPAWLEDPNYVKANPAISDVEHFDAAFFDYSPREAEILDPQSRIFLEVVWEALESAGYVQRDPEEWIGVFAGTSFSTYQRIIESRPDVMAAHGWFPIYLANDRDYFTTRVSYKLDLRGPSMNVQTACSTSLVAVHQACQALLDHQCTLAVAGGVRVGVPQEVGYPYSPGGITSPDGHCRSFDAGGNGSLFGNGAGVVVLKRLDDALADGDAISAVIRGSAINNDGAAKVGFTAPSVEGQAEVIAMAQSVSGVDPDAITYVEAHGSATALGDPIEVAALTDAFRAVTDRTGFCALGSVKSNFGHLEAAAGIAGLIKTVLALEHRRIPPSLHYEKPNPRIDFGSSPFFVNTELRDWRSEDGEPLRAGVSSFGMGGTNVHVVVEEAPAPGPTDPPKPWQLLTLSARTAAALEAATDRLADHLARLPEDDPDATLADVAHTLHLGRRAFEHRRAVVCRDLEDAAAALRDRDPDRLLTLRPKGTERPVAFLFPGLGEHYVGMARGLYLEEEVFRRELDRCAEILEPHLGADLREVLYPEGEEGAEAPGGEGGGMGLDLARMLGRGSRQLGEADRRLNRTRFAQPAVFAVEYALAQLWRSFGVEPEAMLGHSLGEYVAATVAGVFELEDALGLVAERARLIDELPGGGMLAIPLPEAEVTALLGEPRFGELSLSAVNGPEVAVVAGPAEGISALAAELGERGVACRELPTTHAFHSRMMEPATAALAERIAGLTLNPAEIPCVSNVTGRLLTAEEATDPGYWARHLQETVRFADGVAELLRQGERVWLEVGPGHGLGALVQQHPAAAEEGGRRVVVPSLRSSFDRAADPAFLLGALGRLWLAGVEVDWKGFWGDERRRRLHLPTYPFERRRFWIDPGRGKAVAAAESKEEGEATAVDEAAPEATLELHGRPDLATPYEAPEGELEERITAVWQGVLGIEPIGRHDSYFDMGGHSLLAPKVVLRLEKALGVTLPMQALLEHPTVAKLAAVVERARTEGEGVFAEAEAVDLHAEVALDDAVRPAPGAEPAPARSPSALFLSGGTGFLGAYLLAELYRQTDARLFCLARAADADSALARLRGNLERHRVWEEGMAERIAPLAGDLAEPSFGLSEGAFAALAEADAVYHAGAWVNFTYPYRVLKPTNVGGTRDALRVAVLGERVRPVHFVSSTAVFTPRIWELGEAFEDDPLDDVEGLFSGYAETKWVCEKILGVARGRGIPVEVYRPGVISGHSRTGAGNTSDMVWNIMKGSLQLGLVVDRLPRLDVAPVDYVAEAIVRLSLDRDPGGGPYHFSNPEPMPWSEVFAVAEGMGYPLRQVPYAEWRDALGRAADAGEDNALVPFLPLFPEVPRDDDGALMEAPEIPEVRYVDRNTRRALEGTGVQCPPLDPELVRTYLEYFIDVGFIDPPPGGEG